MPKKRQIPFLHWQRLADGTEVGHWKPSPRLRKLGWSNRRLGTRDEEHAVILAALELNRKLAEWEVGGAILAEAPPARQKWNFSNLVQAYRASTEWSDLAASTRREYDVRLRQLEFWTDDGRVPIKAIDRAMVRDLKVALLENGGSRHKCAALLRVLRLLMNWAVSHDILHSNPTDRVSIPTPPSRTTIMLPKHVEAADSCATELGFPSVGLGIVTALWSLQRQGDLLALNQMAWRVLENVDPSDAALLANRKGDVMGFRLRQQKTGAWIDAPMPPFLHDRIEEAFTRSQWLLPDDLQLDRVCPQHLFQRRARAALGKAGLDEFQFRDLRRSGMCMFRDLGVGDSLTVTISGHKVLGRSSILDTYMPPNTRAACAAVAMALRALQRRQSHGMAE